MTRSVSQKNAAGNQSSRNGISTTSSELSEEQMATSLFLGQPCAHDNMAWAHSVAVLRWVRVEAGSFCPLILNSWKNWGNKGLGILRGRYARIDGACGVRTVRIAA